MADIFDELDSQAASPAKDIFDELEAKPVDMADVSSVFPGVPKVDAGLPWMPAKTPELPRALEPVAAGTVVNLENPKAPVRPLDLANDPDAALRQWQVENEINQIMADRLERAMGGAIRPTPEPSLLEKARRSDVGQRLLGPTAEERAKMLPSEQAMPRGALEVPWKTAGKLISMGSIPPQIADPIRKALAPAPGLVQGAAEAVLQFPLTPLGAGVGKAALPIFGADLLANLGEQKQAWLDAMARGDNKEADKILATTGLSGALLAAGGIHQGMQVPPKPGEIRLKSNAVVPRTTAADLVMRQAETQRMRQRAFPPAEAGEVIAQRIPPVDEAAARAALQPPPLAAEPVPSSWQGKVKDMLAGKFDFDPAINAENPSGTAFALGKQARGIEDVKELLRLRRRKVVEQQNFFAEQSQLSPQEKMASFDKPEVQQLFRQHQLNGQLLTETLEKATGFETTKNKPGETFPVQMDRAQLEALDAQIGKEPEFVMGKLDAELSNPSELSASSSEAFAIGSEFKTPEQIKALEEWQKRADAAADAGMAKGEDTLRWANLKHFARRVVTAATKPNATEVVAWRAKQAKGAANENQVTKASPIPPVVSEPAIGRPESQTQAGTAQRSGEGARPAPAQVSLKATKSKDFATNGEWEVETGQGKKKIFYDRDSGMWYEADSAYHTKHGKWPMVSTSNKAEALQTLEEKYGLPKAKTPAAQQPAVESVPAGGATGSPASKGKPKTSQEAYTIAKDLAQKAYEATIQYPTSILARKLREKSNAAHDEWQRIRQEEKAAEAAEKTTPPTPFEQVGADIVKGNEPATKPTLTPEEEAMAREDLAKEIADETGTDVETVQKGTNIEKKDHPEVAQSNPEIVPKLVEDELTKDPEAYDGEKDPGEPKKSPAERAAEAFEQSKREQEQRRKEALAQMAAEEKARQAQTASQAGPTPTQRDAKVKAHREALAATDIPIWGKNRAAQGLAKWTKEALAWAEQNIDFPEGMSDKARSQMINDVLRGASIMRATREMLVSKQPSPAKEGKAPEVTPQPTAPSAGKTGAPVAAGAEPALPQTTPTTKSGQPTSEPPPMPRLEDFKHLGAASLRAVSDAHQVWKKDLAEWEKTQPANKPLIFQGERNVFAITKDPKGGWRYTYFSNEDRMPSGHMEFKTRAEALEDLLTHWGGDGLKRLDKFPFTPVALPARMFPGDTVLWRTATGESDVRAGARSTKQNLFPSAPPTRFPAFIEQALLGLVDGSGNPVNITLAHTNQGGQSAHAGIF